ncbi:MAG: LysR family transcriptional regulator [Eubacterium sp.]|nr:LysR family transcriptional regulator [Eubacterium sp.]
MTLQQILYVLTIEECGSMNKASEKLFIVQPTLTSAVKELENELGITIFHRTHRGVTVTPEGREFLTDIRIFYQHYAMVLSKYEGEGNYKRKFAVSTQHYSFAVKAFVDMAKQYDMKQFDFAIRETKTKEVIRDVGSLRSEIGVIYMSAANEKVLRKYLGEQELEFYPLVECQAYVYLWKNHPLAGEESIGMEQLMDYPCLSFEQEDDAFYFAEEILSEKQYPQTVKVNDRSTMLNLMAGLNGYTLCSGIISGDLNGNNCVVVPFREDENNQNAVMVIGYIIKKNCVPSQMCEHYIEALKNSFS